MEEAEIDRLVRVAKHSRDPAGVDPEDERPTMFDTNPDEPPLKASCANCVSCRVTRMENTVISLMESVRVQKMSMEKMLNRIILLEDTQNEVNILKRVIDVQQTTISDMVDRIKTLEKQIFN